MKKLFLAITLCIVLTQAYSQNTSNTAISKQDYLHKRKVQKTTAWILLDGGVAMALTGAIINISAPWDGKHQNQGVWMVYTGGACALASIPFFISAHHNKKMAASIALQMQHIPVMHSTGWATTSLPSFALRWHF